VDGWSRVRYDTCDCIHVAFISRDETLFFFSRAKAKSVQRRVDIGTSVHRYIGTSVHRYIGTSVTSVGETTERSPVSQNIMYYVGYSMNAAILRVFRILRHSVLCIMKHVATIGSYALK